MTFWKSHRDKNFHDLWQAAEEGILEACDKVDMEQLKCIKFFTYAAYRMKAHLVETAKNSGNIRYSNSYHRKMHAAHKDIKKNMKNLSPIQIHDKWNKFKHEWGAMQNNIGNMPSLDQKIYDDSNATISDTIPNNKDDHSDTMTSTGKRILIGGLRKVMHRILTDKEQTIVKGIYGVDGEERNFKELGEQFNISRSDAQKIRDAALVKIRKDKDFKKVLSSLNIMTSITNGHNVFSLFNRIQ